MVAMVTRTLFSLFFVVYYTAFVSKPGETTLYVANMKYTYYNVYFISAEYCTIGFGPWPLSYI